MDSLITAAARALAAGDPLGALNRVALRDDAPALALRGIAMAQLGDLVRAKALLRSAARAFGPKEAVARARCVVAEAEIALVSRDLGWPAKTLDAARATLEAHGDRVNAAHARYLEVRRLLLIGRLDEAERALAELDPAPFPPALRAAHELVVAGHRHAPPADQGGTRGARPGRARRAPSRHPRADRGGRKRIPRAQHACGAPDRAGPGAPAAARRGRGAAGVAGAGCGRMPSCRARRSQAVSLARRPVLFALARALARRGPETCPRDTLVARAFGAKRADESHRARLRVEVGRLRTVLRPLAGVSATKRGFALAPHRTREVVVLARPVEEQHAAVLAFLADGESWSSSALALALGASQRTVQRALDTLAATGKVQWFGHGRARRWMTPPVPGFTTTLLLPAPLPND